MLCKKDHTINLAMCADADTPDLSVDTNKVAILRLGSNSKEALSQFHASKCVKVD